VNVLEALPSHAWPVRYQATIVDDTIALTVAPEVAAGLTIREIEQQFRSVDIPVTVNISHDDSLLRSVRADLHETTFAGRRN